MGVGTHNLQHWMCGYLSIHFLKTAEPLSYPENLFHRRVRNINYGDIAMLRVHVC